MTTFVETGAHDDEALAESLLGMLASVARTLAIAADLPLRTRRRLALALRKETATLRRMLSTGEQEPDRPRVSIGPEALRLATKPPPRDLGWSILDSVVEGLDLRLLTKLLREARACGEDELLARATIALDAAASLLDVAVARTDELVAVRERTSVPALVEATVRACSDVVRHRRITLLATIDGSVTEIDVDLLGRALTTLTQYALTSMPAHATLQLEVVAGRSLFVDLSFTGRLRAQDDSSALAGLELVFLREVLAAHDAVVDIDERGGRTSIRIEVPRTAHTRIRRSA